MFYRKPRRAIGLLLLCLAAITVLPTAVQSECKSGEPLSPGDHSFDMDFEGINHDYIVHVPPGYDGLRAVPLVVDLHGFSRSGSTQLRGSGFRDTGDEQGFIVVAPTGYMNSWNGDIAFGTAFERELNDVGFMKALVAHLGEIANIDRGRVYATGVSNGAAMSNKLGCEASDTFAAIAPVADPVDIVLDTCMPARPMSVLGFHGYNDEFVPYEGGPGTGPPLPNPFPSIPEALMSWAEVMGCTGMPEVEPIEGRNKCEFYRECEGGVQVGYCSLEGGHALYTQRHLNIADYASKFFQMFSLPLPDADGDGINDEDDNCTSIANPDQADENGNCLGDACECVSNADCDDGTFCNGNEVCGGGGCQAGRGPCLADQACNEGADQCGQAATDLGMSATGGMPGDQSGTATNTPGTDSGAEGGTAGSGASGSDGGPGSPTKGDNAAMGETATPGTGAPSNPVGGTPSAGQATGAIAMQPAAVMKIDDGGCSVVTIRTGTSGWWNGLLGAAALTWFASRRRKRRSNAARRPLDNMERPARFAGR